jgi:plasmid rolling circle replication initiator protein Rep
MVQDIGTKGRLLHYLHYTLNQNTCLNCYDREPLCPTCQYKTCLCVDVQFTSKSGVE